jgi:hypothetical protein
MSNFFNKLWKKKIKKPTINAVELCSYCVFSKRFEESSTHTTYMYDYKHCLVNCPHLSAQFYLEESEYARRLNSNNKYEKDLFTRLDLQPPIFDSVDFGDYSIKLFHLWYDQQ